MRRELCVLMNTRGQILMKRARRVGSEAQKMPMLSSTADQMAVAGLSHVGSVVISTMYRACRRQMDAIAALRAMSV